MADSSIIRKLDIVFTEKEIVLFSFDLVMICVFYSSIHW